MIRRTLIVILTLVFSVVYFFYHRPVNEKDCVGVWRYSSSYLTFLENGEVIFHGEISYAYDLEIYTDASRDPPRNPPGSTCYAKGKFRMYDYSREPLVAITWEQAGLELNALSPLPPCPPWINPKTHISCALAFIRFPRKHLILPGNDLNFYLEDVNHMKNKDQN
ncbi:MAG: hypothetical protein Q4B70_17180 [Lachnospiraceae bacterium]|nr:hypothetical protein [Lachnospiraceae bacterium]